MMLDANDAAAAYAFHRAFLQHLQWNGTPGHWVVKGIYHQFALDALFAAYPDALCIWPHRDPLEVHPSTLAITAVLYGGITNWQMDFQALGPAFEARMRAWLADPANAPNRYGRYDHAMALFGLTRDMVEQAFEGYCRRLRLGRFA